MSMPSARAYGLALVLLGAGGAGLLLAYGLTWATVDVSLLPGSDAAVSTTGVTGRELYPAAAASGWVALASVAGIIATRSWGRSMVAAIALLAGLVGLAGAVAFAVAPSEEPSGASWLAAVLAGAVVAGAAVWTLVRGRAWPVMGGRYERRAKARREISAWDAQDLGRDPTDDLVE